jgi:hypothetical protein
MANNHSANSVQSSLNSHQRLLESLISVRAKKPTNEAANFAGSWVDFVGKIQL